mmetsp:Transcript_21557/g.35695  ORF Transcript_21557/g.35695 Transcript_21557/m.35695 type:complete len:218 (+) Transcript_21557:220-873(+)
MSTSREEIATLKKDIATLDDKIATLNGDRIRIQTDIDHLKGKRNLEESGIPGASSADEAHELARLQSYLQRTTKSIDNNTKLMDDQLDLMDSYTALMKSYTDQMKNYTGRMETVYKSLNSTTSPSSTETTTPSPTGSPFRRILCAIWTSADPDTSLVGNFSAVGNSVSVSGNPVCFLRHRQSKLLGGNSYWCGRNICDGGGDLCSTGQGKTVKLKTF